MFDVLKHQSRYIDPATFNQKYMQTRIARANVSISDVQRDKTNTEIETDEYTMMTHGMPFLLAASFYTRTTVWAEASFDPRHLCTLFHLPSRHETTSQMMKVPNLSVCQCAFVSFEKEMCTTTFDDGRCSFVFFFACMYRRPKRIYIYVCVCASARRGL
jgi:hypothetical protein